MSEEVRIGLAVLVAVLVLVLLPAPFNWVVGGAILLIAAVILLNGHTRGRTRK